MIKVKKQPSFTISNTKPLDRIILKKMIKQIVLWKDYVDYAQRKDISDSDSLDQYTLKVLLGEVDDIASMDINKGINQPSYLASIEPKIKQLLAELQIHNNKSVDYTVNQLSALIP